MIQEVLANPFIPEFGERIKGMGSGDKLKEELQEEMAKQWLASRDQAIESATAMLGVGKEHANRLLEPFVWMTVIITATDWQNFFALRSHPSSNPQQELKHIALLMKEQYNYSKPQELKLGDWHIPLVTENERGHWEEDILVSAGRIARISYNKDEELETWERSYNRGEAMLKEFHLVPFEHQAQAQQIHIGGNNYYGNLHMWKPYRKLIQHESNYSEHVNGQDG
jgi:hypothetical protein